jgi:hypothetical protein
MTWGELNRSASGISERDAELGWALGIAILVSIGTAVQQERRGPGAAKAVGEARDTT